MSRQELRSTGGNCQGDDRQESCSSAGNCQAEEQAASAFSKTSLNIWKFTVHILLNLASESLHTVNAGEGVERGEHSYNVGGNVN